MGQITTTATNCCIKSEQILEMINGGVFPALRNTESNGVSDAVQDSEALGILEKVQTRSSLGKGLPTSTSTRTVDVKYWIPDCADATNPDIVFRDCADVAATVENYGTDRAFVEDHVSDEFAVDVYLYDDNCENPIEELAKKFRNSYMKVKKSFNQKITDKLIAGLGNYFTMSGGTPVSSAVTPMAVNIFSSTAPVKPQPLGLFKVLNQYNRMGRGANKPFLVGGSNKLAAYLYSSPLFAGNEFGNDPNRVDLPVQMYMDYRIDERAVNAGLPTTEAAITFSAGDVSILEWYEFDAPIKATTASGRSIFDPVQYSGTLVRTKMDIGSAFGDRPFIMDVQIEFSECKNKVIYKLRKDFDLWKTPQGLVLPACNLAHNGCLLWDLACGDNDCADLM